MVQNHLFYGQVGASGNFPVGKQPPVNKVNLNPEKLDYPGENKSRPVLPENTPEGLIEALFPSEHLGPFLGYYAHQIFSALDDPVSYRRPRRAASPGQEHNTHFQSPTFLPNTKKTSQPRRHEGTKTQRKPITPHYFYFHHRGPRAYRVHRKEP